jgi:hypothetical protein
MKLSYRGLTHSAPPRRSNENHRECAAGGYFGKAFP